ncbi:MAG: alpha/beta hydrolase [Planctomycetota bacterium]
MTETQSRSCMKSKKIITLGFALKAWPLFLILASTAFGKEYPPNITGATVEKYKTVGDVSLTLWIFNPKDHKPTDKRAAILFFFGGGWTSGSPEQFEPQCKHLAELGMVAITVDYRVGSRNNVKPVSCVADVKSAMRWVRSNAARLGIDPQRIAAGGGSAGGHLAACTAFIKDFNEPGEDSSVSAVPNALVLFNPALVLAPLDGYKFEGSGKRATEERFGTKPENISPAHHIQKGAPPTIIMHGKADTTVPYVTVEAFTAEMKKAGNSCELVGYEGASHGFFNSSKWSKDTITQMDKFLKSLGYLKD